MFLFHLAEYHSQAAAVLNQQQFDLAGADFQSMLDLRNLLKPNTADEQLKNNKAGSDSSSFSDPGSFPSTEFDSATFKFYLPHFQPVTCKHFIYSLFELVWNTFSPPAIRSCGPDWGAAVCRQWVFTSLTLSDCLPSVCVFCEKCDLLCLHAQVWNTASTWTTTRRFVTCSTSPSQTGKQCLCCTSEEPREALYVYLKTTNRRRPPFYCYYLPVGQLTLWKINQSSICHDIVSAFCHSARILISTYVWSHDLSMSFKLFTG